MRDDTQKFIDCLQDAGQLLDDYPAVEYAETDHIKNQETQDHFDLALFEQWEEFFEPGFQQKPSIRIIQHLSCSGGTIISKCVAGLPNVVLLSEANPLSELHAESTPPGFAPSDLIYLAKRANMPHFDELGRDIFEAEIKVMSKHARSFGKHLVIREHSHSDFLVGDTPGSFSTVREFLKKDFDVRSVITVRHPAESYLSLTKLDWLNFSPKTFEEYCRRYILFIELNEKVPVYKYEDFVSDPETEIARICKSLDLPFNEDFMDIFDINVLSGDSGRSSNIIEKRERRKIDEVFKTEMIKSPCYQALCTMLGYTASI